MQKEFLRILKDASLNLKTEALEIDYEKLYQLCNLHHVSSLVYCQIFKHEFDDILKSKWKKEALISSSLQIMKNDRILRLYKKFLEKNLKVLVVKGIILRDLYPVGENRPSNDEDLYVRKEDFDEVRKIILDEDFVIVEESDDVSIFYDKKTQLILELHTSLFSESNQAYGKYQEYFKDVFNSAITHSISGVEFYSLNYDLHFLFLLLHFVKHFLHGGIGIRQVLDIVMYASVYGADIQWKKVYEILEESNLLFLIENVYALAYDHLGFDFKKIDLPVKYYSRKHDYDDLLHDIMDSGLYGKSSSERLHSSTITLNAVSTGKRNLLKSIFLPARSLKYPYLEKHPYLLPFAWCHRIFDYVFGRKSGNIQKTIQLGNKRIELLKKYKMINN